MHNQDHTSRVLHVITDTNRRGAQIFAAQLGDLLSSDALPHRVVALTSGTAGAQLDVPVLGRGTRDLRTLAALRAEMRDADVVVAHGSGTLLACSVAGTGLGGRLIYRNISDPGYWLDSPARRLRVGAMLRRVDRVVALWPGGKDYLVRRLGLEADSITVIPNGVPVGDFRPPTDDERDAARRRFGVPVDGTILVYAAAFQPEKHPEVAVAALGHLPLDHHLLMIGDGPLREQVTRLAADIAPGRVVIAGQIDDARCAYWAADLMVLPSEGEGLPAVLIEAGLCGRAAVASTSGGNADIVVPGQTGVLVDSVDPEELAKGILAALADPTALGAAAIAHCSTRYGLDAVAAQWDRILRFRGGRRPAALAAPASSPPHFLVVGSPRSGTTLVQRLASELPGVRVTMESHFFAVLYDRELRHRRFPIGANDIRGVLARYLELPAVAGMQLDIDALVADLDGRAETPWQLFSAIVRQLAGDARLVGEKTPNHLRWWRPLSDASPGLKFVVVLRDPRAVVASAKEAPFGMDTAVLLAARWAEDLRDLHDAQAALPADRIRVLRYEDVVADPDGARRELGTFLGVEGDAVPIDQQTGVDLFLPMESSWKQQALGPVDPGRASGWRTKLDAREIAQVEALVRRPMARTGYLVESRRLLPSMTAREALGLARHLRSRHAQRRRIMRTNLHGGGHGGR